MPGQDVSSLLSGSACDFHWGLGFRFHGRQSDEELGPLGHHGHFHPEFDEDVILVVDAGTLHHGVSAAEPSQ